MSISNETSHRIEELEQKQEVTNFLLAKLNEKVSDLSFAICTEPNLKAIDSKDLKETFGSNCVLCDACITFLKFMRILGQNK
jgi:hypothetical protein